MGTRPLFIGRKSISIGSRPIKKDFDLIKSRRKLRSIGRLARSIKPKLRSIENRVMKSGQKLRLPGFGFFLPERKREDRKPKRGSREFSFRLPLFGHWSPERKSRSSHFGFRSQDFGHWLPEFGFRSSLFRYWLPISGFRLPRSPLRLEIKGLHVAPEVFATRDEGKMGGVFIVYLAIFARLEADEQAPLEAARAARKVFSAREFDDLRDVCGQSVHLLR